MTGSRVALLLLSCAYQPLLSGQTQPVALDVFLVVDNSGSMRPTDPNFSLPNALSAFTGRLPVNSQLGIIIFDKNVKIPLELTQTASGKFKSEVGDALRKLSYKGSQSDLAGGGERAIYELRQQGRSDARRAIVFVTDGVLDLGSKTATAVKTRWLREDLALEAKRLGITLFVVTMSQAADYQLAQTLARTTGGEYYRALTRADLPFAFAQVNDRLKGMLAPAEVTPANPVDANPLRLSVFEHPFVLGSIVATAVAALLLVLVFARKRTEPAEQLDPQIPKTAREEVPPIPTVSALREHGAGVSRALAAVSDLLAQTDSKVNQFQNAVERYAISNYKVLEDADERCFTLARECILLLDHLDIIIQRAEEKGEPVNSLGAARRRLCSLLETAQIEEIQVTSGDVFDGGVHVPTTVVGSSGPEGVVLEVLRKGYTMKVGESRSDMMLRAAEVIVSTRQVGAKPGPGGTK